ncbi:PREDICTED: kinesin-like protein KIF23 [Dinoponera quadriceps]|uniref:Kinesin-like protein KIF23 n=1 Tax=Dinoponera quadriceps TaxID=609295 RepID=A0A6P3XEN1_DINQU|nr:PREDICTED: kinesin-like protein KIF23 [Dinoponera quadriceps]
MAGAEAEPVSTAELTGPDDEQVIVNLIQSLMKNIQTRDLLRDDLRQKQNNFRNILVELDRENSSLQVENASLRNYSDQQRKIISSLEERTCKLDNQVDSLLYKLNNANDALRNTQQEVRDRDRQLKQHAIDKQKIIEKCSNKIRAEIDRMTREFETKLHEQRERLESHIKKQEEKLKLMKQILANNDNTSDNVAVAAQPNPKPRTEAPEEEPVSTILAKKLSTAETIDSQTPSTSTIGSADATTKSDAEATRNVSKDSVEPYKPSRRDKVPVVNPRYQSRNANKWIDHRPGRLVPVGTILQPQTPSKRSVTKLTDPKPFTSRSARYCLYAQEQDTDGELETRLYKANVLPTSGGGAQVVFNDIECLKQVSPARQKQQSRLVDAENSSVHS